jgi:hypothetical protein
MQDRDHRARLTGALALVVATALLTACGGSDDRTAEAQPATATVAAPSLAENAPQGAAVNAQYWRSQIDTLDSNTKEFADFQSTEFCENPNVAHMKARMISMGQGLGVLSIPYGFKYGGYPTWQNDAETQTKIAYYIVSNYCPEKPA